jgi:cytochrome c peroxidase
MQRPGAGTTDPPVSSYMSVNEEGFRAVFARMTAAKSDIERRHQQLLEARYDLYDRPVAGAQMSRGKTIQGGVRVKLPAGVTWDALAKMTPDEIRENDLFPGGFMPLPHLNHAEGGMVFPKFLIADLKKQTGRDLTRRRVPIWATSRGASS